MSVPIAQVDRYGGEVDMRLEGKVAVIVGAASPIGQACVLRFAREGAKIVAVDRHKETLDKLASEIGKPLALALATDPSTLEGISEVIRACTSKLDRVDVLFNGSGVVDYWEPSDETMEKWGDVFRINVIGPAFLLNGLLPLLSRSPSSSVVFLGSIDGTRGNPTIPAYSASKGGLVPLTHVLADNLAHLNIRVNCLATGLIYHAGPADPHPSNPATNFDKLREVTPLRRRPSADEIASAVLFLGSDESSYMTGDMITLDGGRTAATPGTSIPR